MKQADFIDARELLVSAIRKLNALNHDERTRELSLAITNADQSLMWLEKDINSRSFKGMVLEWKDAIGCTCPTRECIHNAT